LTASYAGNAADANSKFSRLCPLREARKAKRLKRKGLIIFYRRSLFLGFGFADGKDAS